MLHFSQILCLKLSSNALMSVKLSVAHTIVYRHTTLCATLKCNNGFSFVQRDYLLCCPRVWKVQSCPALRCYSGFRLEKLRIE